MLSSGINYDFTFDDSETLTLDSNCTNRKVGYLEFDLDYQLPEGVNPVVKEVALCLYAQNYLLTETQF